VRPWFRPKRYGLGFTPSSWQGWVATGVYVAVLVVLGLTVAAAQPLVFWTVFVFATIAYLLLVMLTRET
jgi:hypothetical protein